MVASSVSVPLPVLPPPLAADEAEPPAALPSTVPTSSTPWPEAMVIASRLMVPSSNLRTSETALGSSQEVWRSAMDQRAPVFVLALVAYRARMRATVGKRAAGSTGSAEAAGWACRSSLAVTWRTCGLPPDAATAR